MPTDKEVTSKIPELGARARRCVVEVDPRYYRPTEVHQLLGGRKGAEGARTGFLDEPGGDGPRDGDPRPGRGPRRRSRGEPTDGLKRSCRRDIDDARAKLAIARFRTSPPRSTSSLRSGRGHFEGEGPAGLAAGDADQEGAAGLCRLGDGLLRGSPGAGGVAVWRGRFLGAGAACAASFGGLPRLYVRVGVWG